MCVLVFGGWWWKRATKGGQIDVEVNRTDEDEIACPCNRDDLATTPLAVLGALDNPGQIEQLDLGALVDDHTWHRRQRRELVRRHLRPQISKRKSANQQQQNGVGVSAAPLLGGLDEPGNRGGNEELIGGAHPGVKPQHTFGVGVGDWARGWDRALGLELAG